MSSATATMEPRAYHLPEEPHLHEGHSTMLGFWMYLMSDCLIFAILFATYAVLGGSFAGGAELYRSISTSPRALLFAPSAWAWNTIPGSRP